MNHKRLDNNKDFDLVINTPFVWEKEPIYLPDTYCIELKWDTLKHFTINSGQKDEQGWLVYYAHNHYRSTKKDSLVLMASNDIYKIFRTSHGVIVKKNDYYTWVFVTDYGLTGGPAKLRWESIQSVQILNDQIIIKLYTEEGDKCFIVDLKTGTAMRKRQIEVSI
jgi:hypothetical protein